MRYWDASAIASLLVQETDTARREKQLREDPNIITWWATKVECSSALNRLHREDQLDAESLRQALSDLDTLAASWVEVAPTEKVRDRALRLLRVHPLRAADSLQLAAVLVAAAENAAKLSLVCADTRLSTAEEELTQLLDKLPEQDAKEMIDFALFVSETCSHHGDGNPNTAQSHSEQKPRPIGLDDGLVTIYPFFYEPFMLRTNCKSLNY